MHIHRDFNELSKALNRNAQGAQRIALVPTMGCIHTGHLQLIKTARLNADTVVASIFVNPMQFSQGEDLQQYPRPLAEDKQQLRAAGTEHLLLPEADTVYPHGLDHHTVVHVPVISNILCGATRKNHFDGVCTVVLKLLLGVRPHVLVLGEKDYQQLVIIRRMVEDLGLEVEVLGVPTVRETDGLACSSRNRYLDQTQRKQASALYNSLTKAQHQWHGGQRDVDVLEAQARADLVKQVSEVEYWTVCEADTLSPLSGKAPDDGQVVICGCVSIGNTRLIDNITCGNLQDH